MELISLKKIIISIFAPKQFYVSNPNAPNFFLDFSPVKIELAL